MKAATIWDIAFLTILGISIHAAREGGDVRVLANVDVSLISIHAAREGGDILPSTFKQSLFKFQSTPPVKAATVDAHRQKRGMNFNPRRP